MIEKPMKPQDMSCFSVKIKPSDIFFLSWLITSYEGLGHLTTEDPEDGRVVILVPPGKETTMREVLMEVKREGLDLEILSEIHAVPETAKD